MKVIVLSVELEASTSLSQVGLPPAAPDGVHVPIRIGGDREGLHRGTAEAYSALAGCYDTGDQVVLFGAGAGAASVCLLAKVLGTVGLVEPDHHLFDFAVAHWLSPAVVRPEGDWARLGHLAATVAGAVPVPITYVGLLHMVTPAELPPMSTSLPTVQIGRHARGIDSAVGESALPVAPGTIDEVWFRGGYPDIIGLPSGDPRLSHRALDWVLDGAQQAGVQYRGTTVALPAIPSRPSPPRRLRRPRASLPDLALVHSSVRAYVEAHPRYWLHLPKRVTWVDTEWPASAERLAAPM
ncbi:phospholipase effector Tle1 domain-containing protein [Mycolicibacterium tokaiense]|uniref:Uncharacterized conserved protein (DUF2235) n=1 Tax=Mycolicibacterium tokaiense TaxID=39695 RepID=A0A378TBM0_9MYCO|nr:DUF2235 domain-containing protein [Mycolicibacterium tokaiense]BBY87330.1 hypothetical protein MTOK_31120 [Mycolicibacterium tokaiense]STZ58159.1 Uncharacterized conserved protein (DUF2235) [Mycolicibacterium tokaiense]